MFVCDLKAPYNEELESKRWLEVSRTTPYTAYTPTEGALGDSINQFTEHLGITDKARELADEYSNWCAKLENFIESKVGAKTNPLCKGIGQGIKIAIKPMMSKYRPDASTPVPGGLDIVTRTWATLHNLTKQLLRATKVNSPNIKLDRIRAEILDMVHPLKPTVQLTWERCRIEDHKRTLLTAMRACSIHSTTKEIQTAVKYFSKLEAGQAIKDSEKAKEEFDQWIIESIKEGVGEVHRFTNQPNAKVVNQNSRCSTHQRCVGTGMEDW